MVKRNNSTSFSIDGFEAVFEDFDKLEAWVAEDVLVESMKEAMEIPLQHILPAIPEASGALKKSFKIRKGKGRKENPTVILGMGGKAFTGDQFYGSFLEFGYHIGNRKLGDKRKEIKGEHFFEYGFKDVEDQTHKRFLEVLAQKTKQELE